LRSPLDILLFSLFGGDEKESILFGVFLAVIIIFMVFDLGFFHKQAHKITTKSALYQSIFWVTVSTLFGCLVYWNGPYQHDEAGVLKTLTAVEAAVLYFTTKLTEYA
jgi:tellurite resistance protein TerC